MKNKEALLRVLRCLDKMKVIKFSLIKFLSKTTPKKFKKIKLTLKVFQLKKAPWFVVIQVRRKNLKTQNKNL